MKEDYLVMGQLVGSFGIKGWIKVKVFTEVVETLENYEKWFGINYALQSDAFIAFTEYCEQRWNDWVKKKGN